MAHKCYISFKTEDRDYKEYIQSCLDVDMIDKSLNKPISSGNEDYILRKIREDCLADSTVTIHLIGRYSAESLGYEEQRFIKRELQASLYNSQSNTRSGILGIVLPSVTSSVYTGNYICLVCGNNHNGVSINDGTTVQEFSYNYYIPNGKCFHREDDRYCILTPWDAFCADPDIWIEAAFAKRSDPISEKVRVYGR